MGPTRANFGFTLIELVACITIMGLLAGGAALSLKAARQRVEFDQVASRLGDYLHSVRVQAQTQGKPASLIFNSESVIQKREGDRLAESQKPALQLPYGFSIDEVRFLIGEQDWRVEISPHGWAPSFVVKLVGPAGEQRWLFFCGLSGQQLRVDDEEHTQDILALLGTRGGLNAH